MGEYVAVQRLAVQALLTAAFALSASTAAVADSTTLLCDTGNSNNGLVTLVLDKDAGKVTITRAPMRNNPSLPVIAPATVDAIFDPTTVHFSEKPDSRTMDYSLNRSTANISVTEIEGDGAAFHFTWTCQVNKPQF